MITRFAHLYSKDAKSDQIDWPDLFSEFSKQRPFLGSEHHPGWSPAEFEPPQRALAHVKRIHALVLDYDNKTTAGDRVENPITIEAISEALGDYYGLIHTSRHHTKEWPRFRVILPFTRPISKLEYTVLWQTAAKLWPGVDPSPKDSSRFWYTPGLADHAGAEFQAITLCGAWLDPDEFIDKRQEIVRQQQVTAPATTMEARARAYVAKMPEAISGAGGHDATWAVARKLVCDFGLDEQAAFRILATEYNPRCQPPWDEKDLWHKIAQAKKAHTVNPISDRPLPTLPERPGFGEGVVDPPSEKAKAIVADNWEKNLRYDANARLTKDVGNLTLVLRNADGFAGSLCFNTMANRVYWLTAPKYEVGIKNKPRANTKFEEHHAVYIQHVFSKLYGITVGKDIVFQAVDAAAHENEIHPVQDYLKQLPAWDGKRRVPTWLHNYIGAADTDYNAAVGRWWLISAVARAMRPGCQVDHVLILEGGQGAGKSQAVRALGGSWTLGSLPDIRDRDRAADTIGGFWLVEIAELDALKGASMTRIKEFVSQQSDSYRPAYARTTVDRPRGCVFIGTTNESMYLSDPTGARRFWPVKIEGDIDLEGLHRDRDQIWAEALLYFQNGEAWWPDRQYVGMIEEEQAQRYAEDSWTSTVQQWIERNGVEGFTLDAVLAQALNIEQRFWDRSTETRVGGILTKLGCTRRRVSIGGRRQYCYFPKA